MSETTNTTSTQRTVEVGRATTRHAAAGNMTICGAGTKHGMAAYLTHVAEGTEGVTCARCLKKLGVAQ